MGALPDPSRAKSLDEIVLSLRLLKAFAKDVSYAVIAQRINRTRRQAGRPRDVTSRSTVAGYFTLGRARLDEDLLVAIVLALRPDADYAERWRKAIRVIRGAAAGSAIVETHNGLPADPACFVGRESELGLLTAASGPAVTVISGMPGAGKTQLAVHAAHELLRRGAGRDVQLFADLRGFDPAAPPADPSAVLAGFLRALGTSSGVIPAGLADRITAFRQLMKGRRAVVVLDNAADGQSVLPLLPHSPGVRVLITSRHALADLSSATQLRLQLLDPQESLRLLRAVATPEQVDVDLASAGRIAELLGHLPLALSVIGGHLRAHPQWLLSDCLPPLTSLVMDGGVQAALALSDGTLPPSQRQLLRLLAVQPGQDIGLAGVAALMGQPADEARAELSGLVAAQLLQVSATGRYTFHNLVREYGKQRADLEEPFSRQAVALRRLLGYHRAAVMHAIELLYTGPAAIEKVFTTVDDARAWMESERANVLAAAVESAAGEPEHVIALSRMLYQSPDLMGHYDEISLLHETAAAAARQSGDMAGRAHALVGIGYVLWRRGDYPSATDHHRLALEIFVSLGDRIGQARVLSRLGLVYGRLDDNEQAVRCQQQALELFTAEGDAVGQGISLVNLGAVHWRLGDYRAAADCHLRALATYLRVGNLAGQAAALANLGNVHIDCRRLQLAGQCHRLALAGYVAVGYRTGEAEAMNNLGMVHELDGDYPKAADYQQRALDLFTKLDNPHGRAHALIGLGHVRRLCGQHAEAEEFYQQALSVHCERRHRLGQAEAWTGLGDNAAAVGDHSAAARAYAAALVLASRCGAKHHVSIAHHGLAQAHMALGKTGEADKHRRAAAAIDNALDRGDDAATRQLLALAGYLP